jgi:hypothetical protein
MFRTLRNYRLTVLFGVSVTRVELKLPSLPPAPRVITTPSSPPPTRPLAGPGLAKALPHNVVQLATRRKAG